MKHERISRLWWNFGRHLGLRSQGAKARPGSSPGSRTRLEAWQRGLSRRFAKPVHPKGYRGFESHRFRQFIVAGDTGFHVSRNQVWKVGRVVYRARLESVYAPKGASGVRIPHLPPVWISGNGFPTRLESEWTLVRGPSRIDTELIRHIRRGSRVRATPL